MKWRRQERQRCGWPERVAGTCPPLGMASSYVSTEPRPSLLQISVEPWPSPLKRCNQGHEALTRPRLDASKAQAALGEATLPRSERDKPSDGLATTT
ncbi:hypothetical protein NL676_022133 [Syzygium grande]|nr:hypothetical protein NL676_022133 [Syzygium grande]